MVPSDSLLRLQCGNSSTTVIRGKHWLRYEFALAPLLGLSYVLFVVASAPLGQAFQYGIDEAFELNKAYVNSLGYELYTDVWDDQPPLHTVILAAIFRGLGPSVLAARVLTACFAGLLLAALYDVIRMLETRVAAIVVVVTLIAWPTFMHLSVSAMLEPPAMAMGMLSMNCWLRARTAYNQKSTASCCVLLCSVLSGIFMGLGLQVKWTAGIFIPAMACVLVTGWCARRERRASENRWLNLTLMFGSWSVVAWLTFFSVSIFFPGELFEQILRSHFSDATRNVLATSLEHSFALVSLQLPCALVFLVCIGVVHAIASPAPGRITALLLLISVCAVHHLHRPYWSYYALHFAIPASWLVGVLVTDSWKWLVRGLANGRSAAAWVTVAGVMAYVIVTGCFLCVIPGLLREGVNSIAYVRLRADQRVVEEISQEAREAQWVFTMPMIYAFHVGKPVPPELAVLSDKRFWSEQITYSEIERILRKYQPDVIYIERESWREALGRLLMDSYKTNASGRVHVLKEERAVRDQ